MGNKNELWDLESGVGLGFVDATKDSSFFEWNDAIFKIEKGILWEINEESFGLYQAWEGFTFGNVIEAKDSWLVCEKDLV